MLAECEKPTIADGNVTPGVATIAVGEAFTVTFTPGYALFGDSTVTCGEGGELGATPECKELGEIFVIYDLRSSCK